MSADSETGAPEPSAWMTPVRGSTVWGSRFTASRQDATSVPLYTLSAAREIVARELEEEARQMPRAREEAQEKPVTLAPPDPDVRPLSHVR